jgi:hypothetical protein
VDRKEHLDLVEARMRSVNRTAIVRNDHETAHRPMLGNMDHPVRFVAGSLLVLLAAVTLAWTIGKPPEWNPTFLGLTPRGLGGRDRVRIYALVALVAGAVVAIYFGMLAR